MNTQSAHWFIFNLIKQDRFFYCYLVRVNMTLGSTNCIDCIAMPSCIHSIMLYNISWSKIFISFPMQHLEQFSMPLWSWNTSAFWLPTEAHLVRINITLDIFCMLALTVTLFNTFFCHVLHIRGRTGEDLWTTDACYGGSSVFGLRLSSTQSLLSISHPQSQVYKHLSLSHGLVNLMENGREHGWVIFHCIVTFCS